MEISKSKNPNLTYYDKNKIADDYYDVVGKNIDGEKQIADSGIRDYLKEIGLFNLKGKKVLDLGCGNGKWAEHFLDFEPESVTGIDISEEMIKRANERKRDNKLKFMRGDLLNIPLGEDSMDVIFSRFSLCYVKDIEKAIHEIKRVLTFGGELYVITSFSVIEDESLSDKLKNQSVPLLLGSGEKKVRLENCPHSLARYRRAFEMAGLTVNDERTFGAEDLVIPEDYPHRDKIRFSYVVFKAKK